MDSVLLMDIRNVLATLKLNHQDYFEGEGNIQRWVCSRGVYYQKMSSLTVVRTLRFQNHLMVVSGKKYDMIRM